MLCFVNAIGSIEMSSKKQVGVDGAGGARKAVSARGCVLLPQRFCEPKVVVVCAIEQLPAFVAATSSLYGYP
jgi:hypothetical protein